jgi:hypothetical protein
MRWHREWRAESLGFGVAGVALLWAVSPIVGPALAIGAARLVHEIEGDAMAQTPAGEPAPPPGDTFEETFS